MAPRFFGSYERSLDAKGRIILPAPFRAFFDTQAFLSQHQERCLALWTPEVFEQQWAEMEARQRQDAESRNLARVWAAGLYEVELDRQGRVSIPPRLREYAELESAVLVTGSLNRVELWNPAGWEARVDPAVALLSQDQPVSPPTVETDQTER